MKDFWKFTGATVVGLCLFLAIGWLMSFMMLISIAVSGSSSSETKLKSHSVYELELDGTIEDRASSDDNLTAALQGAMGRDGVKVYGLNDLLENIKKADENSEIDGIYLKFGSFSAGFATLKELRNALEAFKFSGKFIVAYSDSYSQGAYYLASVADKICMHPIGALDWKGLSSTIMFTKRISDKLGVEMQVFKVGTYKSAVEPYILTKMSDANREQMNVLLGDMWEDVCATVAEGRHLSTDKLNELAAQCLTFDKAETIVAEGLVDTLLYKDDIDGVLTSLCGTDNYKLVSHNKMKNVKALEKKRTKNKIAVVYASGQIVDEGKSGIIGDDMVETLNDIKDDESVKAVVLRVNSPGGSAFASENICQAVKNIRAKGKPVVVSMGDYAASGGYYISSNADYIIAQPTTLTGSIGIFGLVPNVRKAADMVGVDFDGVATHPMASFQTDMVYGQMSETERRLMQQNINRGYDLFTSRCAEGRDTTQQYIFTIAEGRVWSGKRALELGLVDQLGSLCNAVDKASELADLDYNYKLAEYPEPEDFATKLLKALDIETRIDRIAQKRLGSAYKIAKQIEQLSAKPSIEASMEFVPVIE